MPSTDCCLTFCTWTVESGFQKLREPCQESFVCSNRCLPKPDYDLDCGLHPTRSLADFPLLYPIYSSLASAAQSYKPRLFRRNIASLLTLAQLRLL
ncbi:unnamed protein product [Chondrus crispus]|uniref:Uncharacterized protein n=1 Tax=Chondrus crispus TaxID=2769 RepID=R7QBS0_CHOCR|nr:unnamed protein product [Chondrus crispus]CDF35238.1 unnamed protein product [Chondrus crispus]|eukprot:XP_005715057.1 unnamed protein product [Chondrus crispus]